MKKLHSILSLALAASLAIAISSCKDDEESKSKTQLLTSKTWSVSKVEISFSGTTIDISSDWMLDCEKDNSVKFSTDGTYEEKIGTDNCGGDEVNASGTWTWKSSETILSVSIHSDVEDWKLVSINETTLKVNVGTMSYDSNGDGTDDKEVDVIITLAGK